MTSGGLRKNSGGARLDLSSPVDVSRVLGVVARRPPATGRCPAVVGPELLVRSNARPARGRRLYVISISSIPPVRADRLPGAISSVERVFISHAVLRMAGQGPPCRADYLSRVRQHLLARPLSLHPALVHPLAWPPARPRRGNPCPACIHAGEQVLQPAVADWRGFRLGLGFRCRSWGLRCDGLGFHQAHWLGRGASSAGSS